MSRSKASTTPRVTFLLDENVDVRIGTFLKINKYQVRLSPKGISDEALLALVVHHCVLLLTHDKDFTNSDRYKPDKTYGIIVLRVHPPTFELVQMAVIQLLETTSLSILYGTITIVTKEGIAYINR